MSVVMEGIGPIILKDGWDIRNVKRWLDFYISPTTFRIDSGFFQGKEKPLAFFDIYLEGYKRGAIVYQDSKERWWIDDYAPPFGMQIYDRFFSGEIATGEQKNLIQPVKEPVIIKAVTPKPKAVSKPKEKLDWNLVKLGIDFTPKHKVIKSKYTNPKPIERVRGSIYPPTTIPKAWLEPRKKKNSYLNSKGQYVEYGGIEYCDEFELSQIREKLETRHYSFVA